MALAVAHWTLLSTALAQEAPRSLSMAEAVALAAERGPGPKVAAAELAEAEGRLRSARTYPHDPEIELEWARRDEAGGNLQESTVALSQEVEIAGQTAGRARVARAELEAARSSLARERRARVAGVKATFAEAVRARELLALEEVDADIARRFLEAAGKRDAAGAGTEIELNLARAEVGRAERRAHQARAGYAVARALLAEAVGLDPAGGAEPRGDVEVAAPPLPLRDLLDAARTVRPELHELRLRREAASARIALARREAVPNVVVRLFDGSEGDESIRGAGIAVAIPLFDRNQGAVAEARAEGDRVTWELRRRELEVVREVVAAHAAHEASRDATRSIEESVVGTLEENLRLLERAFDAGKVGFTEILLIRRELVEARREHIEAQAEAWQAAITLELASATDSETDPTEVTR